jgi:predicted amino acid-binding ACT domain protein
VIFVTPLQSDREIAAAAEAGFNVTHTLHSIRVVGRDRPGIAAELTQKLADASINLRGFSAAVFGTQFIAYIAVDSLQDANQAIEILELGWRFVRD